MEKPGGNVRGSVEVRSKPNLNFDRMQEGMATGEVGPPGPQGGAAQGAGGKNPLAVST